MLINLLRLLSEGGVVTFADLARKLEVGEQSLKMMMEDLARLGYLVDPRQQQAKQDECGSTCHCSGCSGCSPKRGASPPMWEVTDKGLRLLKGRAVEPSAQSPLRT